MENNVAIMTLFLLKHKFDTVRVKIDLFYYY